MADEEYRREEAGSNPDPVEDRDVSGEQPKAADPVTEDGTECGDACREKTAESSCEAKESAGTEEAKASEDGASDAEASEPEQAEKKGFFSRNKKADKEKAELKEKVDSLEDRVRRQMAEFDNFRKRTEKEKDQMFSMGERSVIEKILPIVDNFERGFDTVANAEEEDAFVAGMRKIYTQLIKQLEAIGVAPIEAVGKEFNPELHNAVMQVETAEYESGIVAQELQKGYMYHDQVLRHSMVAVAQ